MTEICPRRGKLFRGCYFEARYDLGEPKFEGPVNYVGSDLKGVIDRHRAKSYVRDVCVRCGKVIERQK